MVALHVQQSVLAYCNRLPSATEYCLLSQLTMSCSAYAVQAATSVTAACGSAMPTLDSSYVAAGLASGHAAVADMRCGQLVGCWRAHDAEITSVSSQGSHLLLTCSQVGHPDSAPAVLILLGWCCCCPAENWVDTATDKAAAALHRASRGPQLPGMHCKFTDGE